MSIAIVGSIASRVFVLIIAGTEITAITVSTVSAAITTRIFIIDTSRSGAKV